MAKVIIVNVGYRSTNYWVVSAGRSRLLVDLGWANATISRWAGTCSLKRSTQALILDGGGSRLQQAVGRGQYLSGAGVVVSL